MDFKKKKRIGWIIVCSFILTIGTYNAIARFQSSRPQVIAAGIDPPLVETDKPKPGSKILALIRPGSDPISTVQLIVFTRSPSVIPGQVSPVVATPVLDLKPTGDKLGKDVLYTVDAPIDPGATQKLIGLKIPLPWGTGENEVAIRVTDTAGKTHIFPEIEFDLAPYPSAAGYGGGYSVFE